MKGYKAFNDDLTCRGFQYEIGQTYETDEPIELCERGFHFCEKIIDCYTYYPMSSLTRICEVEALGNVKTDGIKFVTNKIRIVCEVVDENTRKGNTGSENTGYGNIGDWNSGNRNSGNCNSGNWNSGDCNSGNCNSGNRNSGNWNSGDCNSGDCNSGNWNSGDCNSGNCNSGDWNATNYSSGCFCTIEPKLTMFDKPTDWSMRDWRNSDAYIIMQGAPVGTYQCYDENTTDDTLKTYTKEDMLKWWVGLPDEKKSIIRALPNYDEDKFLICIGLKGRR